MEKGVHNARWEKAFDRLLTPLEEFIHRQTTSGMLLMICAVVALVIANSPLYESYEHLLHTPSAWASARTCSACRSITGSTRP